MKDVLIVNIASQKHIECGLFRSTTHWRCKGRVGFGEMVTLAEETDNQTWIHPNDPVFRFSGKWKQKLKKNGVKWWTKSAATKGQIVRVVLESLALTYLETVLN